MRSTSSAAGRKTTRRPACSVTKVGSKRVRILLPNEAPWLAEFESELLAFPNDRHDDQVDALLLFLDWLAENEHCIVPVIASPVVVRVERPGSIRDLDPQW